MTRAERRAVNVRRYWATLGIAYPPWALDCGRDVRREVNSKLWAQRAGGGGEA